MHRLSGVVFTSNERRFIYEVAKETLKVSKSVLTRTVFEYEVRSKINSTEAAYYIGEWNYIEGLTPVEHPDVLIAKLEEANKGRKVMMVAERAVELLEKGDIKGAVAHLKKEAMMISSNKEDRPVVELTDFSRRLQTIYDKKLYPEKYKGILTGFKTFDLHTGGLYAGELTLLAGVTGIGKSTILKQLEVNIVRLNPGKNVLHIANEEYLEQVEHKFDAIYTEIPYQNFKRADMTDEQIELWKNKMLSLKNSGEGRIFLKEIQAFTDVTVIEQTYRELENLGIPIHVIVIDHLPHIMPIEEAWGENDERFKAAADCKELARWLRVPVVVPTQAATEVEEKQSKGRRAGRLDVYGSKGQIHVANTFFIITYKGTDDTQTHLQDWERDVFWMIDVKKNRDGPPFWFMAKHLVKHGGVVEISSDTVKEQEAQKAAKQVIAEDVQNIRDEAMKTMAAVDGNADEPSVEVKGAINAAIEESKSPVVGESVVSARSPGVGMSVLDVLRKIKKSE